MADTIASNLIAPVKKKQELLEQPNLIARFEALLIAMATEMDTLETETRIRNRVKQQMEKINVITTSTSKLKRFKKS